ncbi:hypothetical protein [Campylobacter sp. RM12651]|uniref:hypothetical protein n=1 Tax=Campylobacter sp. RM12651 TaxID=1660079 RepID=UPI001EFA4DA9|nr:hypothetical protein [Campylobacter sp. RM12651]ULO04535.1 hypothetical protein AVBRAN_a0053 [Campylobacter sp. RM12651]
MFLLKEIKGNFVSNKYNITEDKEMQKDALEQFTSLLFKYSIIKEKNHTEIEKYLSNINKGEVSFVDGLETIKSYIFEMVKDFN